MASKNRKITDLPSALPGSELNQFFVIATPDSNFKFSYEDVSEYSSIGVKSGVYKETLSLSGHPVLTGHKDGSSPFPNENKVKEIIEESFSDFVYFSDFTNNNGPTYKVYTYNTNLQKGSLSGVYVDDLRNCTAKLRWDGPPEHYVGTGYINGIQILNENISEIFPSSRNFEGSSEPMNLFGKTELIGEANGALSSITLNLLESGPSVANFIFPDYSTTVPADGTIKGTSAVKEGDKIKITLEYDKSELDMPFKLPTGVYIYDEGLCQEHEVSDLSLFDAGNGFYQAEIEAPVSNRDGDQSISVHSVNLAGITGAKQTSSETLLVDNSTPTLSVGSISYPTNNGITQSAIKYGEIATIDYSVFGADNIFAESSQVNVPTLSVSEFDTSVSYRAGDYNFDTPNITFFATKFSNGARVSSSASVNIANSPLTLQHNLPSELTSNPDPGTEYEFTITSDQKMLEAPALSLDPNQSPQSVLFNILSGVNEEDNKFLLNITDGDGQGVFSFSAVAYNLAGLETNNVAPSYSINGASERSLPVDPRSLLGGLIPLGFSPTDANLLYCENLSAGGEGPNNGTVYTFQDFDPGTVLSEDMDYPDKFTLCNPDGVIFSGGDHLFNLDQKSRAANTSVDDPAIFIIRQD